MNTDVEAGLCHEADKGFLGINEKVTKSDSYKVTKFCILLQN